eukprot:TRINITY_DN14346_c0_g1_i2.p1 TRINITY_DN14346_c0_g1~~TRINITY_DN14346_c0_g1_i2.p1  ORF type:complete len:726 (-),score=152.06 TRINITY_DN14346_c0_g1_i2:71-2218(-)
MGLSLALRASLLAACLALVSAEEGEKPSKMAVAIAATLLGAISFQLSLYYLTNHPDDDMRKYSYEIINATVSIFSAVLLFQSFNDIVETCFLEGRSLEFAVAVDMLHMLVWFAILQLVLAKISGAIGSKPKNLESMEMNMKSVAVLLAHLTGFASINAWGSLQQLEFFNTPLMSFAVIPISCTGQFLLQRITDSIRERVSKGDDGIKDEYEEAWDEETEECENDVMGLTLSFNMTQAIRFGLTGTLPNQEGEVEWPDLRQEWKMNSQFWIYGVGAALAFSMTVTFMLMPRKSEGEGETWDGQQVEDAASSKENADEEEEESSLVERSLEVVVLTLSMGFAWCVFFATRIWLTSWPDLEDPMLLGVVLTMVITIGSLCSIRLLDLLADADFTGERADDAIKQLIKAIGLLVGFGWEQCFDQAIVSLSSACPYKHSAKLVLGLFCVSVIVPAWKWYILPMAVKEGWKFGFFIDDEDKFAGVIDHLHATRESMQKIDEQKFKELRESTIKATIQKHGVEKARSSLMHLRGCKTFENLMAEVGGNLPEHGEPEVRQPVEVPYVALPSGPETVDLQSLQQQLEIVKNLRSELSVGGKPAVFRKEGLSTHAPLQARSLTPPRSPGSAGSVRSVDGMHAALRQSAGLKQELPPQQQTVTPPRNGVLPPQSYRSPLPRQPIGRSPNETSRGMPPRMADDLSELETLTKQLLESGLFQQNSERV